MKTIDFNLIYKEAERLRQEGTFERVIAQYWDGGIGLFDNKRGSTCEREARAFIAGILYSARLEAAVEEYLREEYGENWRERFKKE